LAVITNERHSGDCIVLARRWVVERTFCGFRLAKDYEKPADILAASIALAGVRIAARPLTQSSDF
jgi:hypothetical protein